MMKIIKKIKSSKASVTLVWVLGILVIWEIFAFVVAATKPNPRKHYAAYMADSLFVY